MSIDLYKVGHYLSMNDTAENPEQVLMKAMAAISGALNAVEDRESGDLNDFSFLDFFIGHSQSASSDVNSQ